MRILPIRVYSYGVPVRVWDAHTRMGRCFEIGSSYYARLALLQIALLHYKITVI